MTTHSILKHMLGCASATRSPQTRRGTLSAFALYTAVIVIAMLGSPPAAADKKIELAIGETHTNRLGKISDKREMTVKSSNPEIASAKWIRGGRSPYLLIKGHSEGEALVTTSGQARYFNPRTGEIVYKRFEHFTDVKVSGATETRSLKMRRNQYQNITLPAGYKLEQGSIRVYHGKDIVRTEWGTNTRFKIIARKKIGSAEVWGVLTRKTKGGDTERVRLTVYVEVAKGRGKKRRPRISLTDMKAPTTLGIVILGEDGQPTNKYNKKDRSEKDKEGKAGKDRRQSMGGWELEDSQAKASMIASRNVSGHATLSADQEGFANDGPPPTLINTTPPVHTRQRQTTPDILVDTTSADGLTLSEPITTEVPQPRMTQDQPDPVLIATIEAIEWGIRHGSNSSDICAAMDVVVATSLINDFWLGATLRFQHTDPGGNTREHSMLISERTRALMMLQIYSYGWHILRVMSVIAPNGQAFLLQGNPMLRLNVDASEPNVQLCR